MKNEHRVSAWVGRQIGTSVVFFAGWATATWGVWWGVLVLALLIVIPYALLGMLDSAKGGDE